MSLLLEALQQSRSSLPATAAQTDQARQLLTPVSPSRRRRPLWIAVALGLTAVAATGLWFARQLPNPFPAPAAKEPFIASAPQPDQAVAHPPTLPVAMVLPPESSPAPTPSAPPLASAEKPSESTNGQTAQESATAAQPVALTSPSASASTPSSAPTPSASGFAPRSSLRTSPASGAPSSRSQNATVDKAPAASSDPLQLGTIPESAPNPPIAPKGQVTLSDAYRLLNEGR